MIGLRRPMNPERLWVHYAIALFAIVALLASVLWVHGNMIKHSKQSTEHLRDSLRLAGLSQEILLIVSTPDTTDLDEIAHLTAEFETAHLTALYGYLWSDALQSHFFDGDPALNGKVREFADLAIKFVQFPEDQRPIILAKMQALHGPGGVYDGLLSAVSLLDLSAQAETDRLNGRLMSLLGASLLVLIAEALLIFWPAQRAVASLFGELRQKTDVLTKSQDQLRQMNDRLFQLANHDQLTGLPNRSYMTTHITAAFEDGQTHELGVLFLGLDGFKTINEMIGHENADLFLIAVAGRLVACVDDDDLVARVGGDEFLLTTKETPEQLVKRVFATLADPIVIDGRNVSVNASIGYLSAFDEDCETDEIVANAGIAMQAAKAEGGRKAVAYSQSLRESSAEFHQIQIELKEAIANGEFEPWFQPQLNLADGTLRGAEVLARWRHPTRGMISPDKFLPAAEQAGLIVDLDHAIWRAAIAAASRWQEAGCWDASISLNAAPDTISDPYLIEKFLKALHSSSLGIDQVVIEVLETTLIESSDDLAAINIDSLAECGIALELDDFGTGYASLSRLTQLPLSGIKLDRSLIAPLPDGAADSVVRAILALSKELRLEVVAEGIEDRAQAEILSTYGCEVGQGYSFGKPMPVGEFEDWLKTATRSTKPRSNLAQFPRQA